MTYSLTTLKDIIIPAAQEELLPRFTRVERQHKRDGSVITEADLAMQSRIAGELQARWPDTVFLGEEMGADEQAGLLEVVPDPGEKVKRGQTIGRLTNVFGDLIAEYTAQEAAIVLGKSVNPVSQAGGRIVYLGVPRHQNGRN